jgi:hypothetical protein
MWRSQVMPVLNEIREIVNSVFGSKIAALQ